MYEKIKIGSIISLGKLWAQHLAQKEELKIECEHIEEEHLRLQNIKKLIYSNMKKLTGSHVSNGPVTQVSLEKFKIEILLNDKIKRRFDKYKSAHADYADYYGVESHQCRLHFEDCDMKMLEKKVQDNFSRGRLVVKEMKHHLSKIVKYFDAVDKLMKEMKT